MIRKLLNKILNKKITSISFKKGMDATELPIVSFYQGKTKINFLLDTGATTNIIDKKALEKIDHTMLETKTSVTGLEGIQKTGETCSLSFTFKNHTYTNVYAICDMSRVFNHVREESGITINGILGSQFFNTYKYVLDFSELIAYSKK